MIRSVVLVAVFFASVPGYAADQVGSQRAITHHVGKFNRESVPYTSIVESSIIADPSGTASASLVTIEYLREKPKDAAHRPVTFVFNGGPGASSSPLHMHALGPKRIAETASRNELEDNPFSVLDVTDLVFIDPIGTGFSRALGVDGQPFWTVSGDAASVASFIGAWLKDHHREGSPHFLCGESYGASRAAQILAASPDLSFDGVILLSMTGMPADTDLRFVLMLPTMATVARFHGKSPSIGGTPLDTFDQAAAFAASDYVTALIKGSALSQEARHDMARKLSTMIGLPQDLILRKDLRIEKADFVRSLLKDQGQIVGQIDARDTGELSRFVDQKPPGDDPSMSDSPKGPSTSEILQLYLTKTLAFKTDEKYRSLNLEVNAKWKYDVERVLQSPAAVVGDTLKTRSTMRVFWSGGIYDLATPMYAGIYTLNHSAIPADRLTIARFPSGHGVYDGEENLARFAAAIRSFLTLKTAERAKGPTER